MERKTAVNIALASCRHRDAVLHKHELAQGPVQLEHVRARPQSKDKNLQTRIQQTNVGKAQETRLERVSRACPYRIGRAS